VGLLDRVRAELPRGAEQRSSIDTWISDYLIPSTFGYGGVTYPIGGLQQSLVGARVQEVAHTLPGYMAALRGSPPAFAAQMVRALVLSQARFAFRNRRSRGTFGTTALAPLETPWPNATTGQLLSRMEWHAGLTGNAYVVRQPGRLRVIRPDWTAIVFGSDQEPEDAATALDGDVIGYVYVNGGLSRIGDPGAVSTLLPADVAHWSPMPDPEQAEVGMAWLTPALRDLQGDRAATEHKLKFFTNGATPNLVIKGIPAATQKQFDDVVEMMESNHAGVANAYKTLYLTAGADATVVGSDLKQVDFKATQGAGETRLSVLSRVPAALLGISEGLAGSALNAGNFGQARRSFADTWVFPMLQDVAAALARLVQVPAGAELWFDVTDMPLLREDAKDAADIEAVKQATISGYVRDGFTPESAVAAVSGQDVSLLQHTGLLSVQLQPPGAQEETPSARATRVAGAIRDAYLGVGVMVTPDEARELLNEAGADLPIPGPVPAPAPQPAPGGP
jgi:phage portal protein BeeE